MTKNYVATARDKNLMVRLGVQRGQGFITKQHFDVTVSIFTLNDFFFD
jgi:hypothetical protein